MSFLARELMAVPVEWDLGRFAGDDGWDELDDVVENFFLLPVVEGVVEWESKLKSMDHFPFFGGLNFLDDWVSTDAFSFDGALLVSWDKEGGLDSMKDFDDGLDEDLFDAFIVCESST